MSASMLDKWTWTEEPRTEVRSIEKACAFLDGPGTLEDWGCGNAYAKRFIHQARYIGIDGSGTFCDVKADLRRYRSSADFILLRHVLEHNRDWRCVLENALASFRQKLCIVIYTPFSMETHEIEWDHGVDAPVISFRMRDIAHQLFGQTRFVDFEMIETATVYGLEHLFYITGGGDEGDPRDD